MDRTTKRRLKVFQLITKDQSSPPDLDKFSEALSEFQSSSNLTFSSSSSYATEGFRSMDFSFLDLPEPAVVVHAPSDFSQPDFSTQLYSSVFPVLGSKPSQTKPLNYLNPLTNSLNLSTEDSSREEIQERGRPKKRPLFEEEKNLYVIQLDLIKAGKDLRTTVMIKNIPNKYSQKMLLGAINKSFAGTYNFLYLPIDFKNRCNVGYAFINFVDCRIICDFFEEFNGKRWEKFNSEKICALAYARIQGLQELLTHFQNSSVINQDDNKIKPVILAKFR